MISIHDIKIGYGHCEVASSEGNLEIIPGKFIGLLGANGSGKSTLLRAIHDGSHIITGEVHLDGEAIHTVNKEQLAKRISIVYTDREFSRFLTVYEMLVLSRAPYANFLGNIGNEDHDYIASILELLGINNLKDRRLSTLSDGQLQVVVVARSLVQDTNYILMDEPSHHLDVHHRAALFIALKKHCHTFNKAILFSTHEIQMSLELCDGIMFINEGRINMKSTSDFIKSQHLKNMFPSKYIKFDKGKIQLNTDL